jgi:hypothetical protein
MAPSPTLRAAALRRRHQRKSPPRSCKFRSHVAIFEVPTTDVRKVAEPPLVPPLAPPLPLPNSPRRTRWPPTRKPQMLVLPSPLWSSRPAPRPLRCWTQPSRAATAQWCQRTSARRSCESLNLFAIQCRLLTCEKPTRGGACRRTSCCCCCTEHS